MHVTGNSGDSSLIYPAAYSSVISVAAVDGWGARASFSTYNSEVDISAPGVNIRRFVKHRKCEIQQLSIISNNVLILIQIII